MTIKHIPFNQIIIFTLLFAVFGCAIDNKKGEDNFIPPDYTVWQKLNWNSKNRTLSGDLCFVMTYTRGLNYEILTPSSTLKNKTQRVINFENLGERALTVIWLFPDYQSSTGLSSPQKYENFPIDIPGVIGSASILDYQLRKKWSHDTIRNVVAAATLEIKHEHADHVFKVKFWDIEMHCAIEFNEKLSPCEVNDTKAHLAHSSFVPTQGIISKDHY